jgi:hypothetical protein
MDVGALELNSYTFATHGFGIKNRFSRFII